mmetsp:Transcript_38600/g.64958  ORF Transcript_38600/g.64958 Transcript_38600/m.64958 type:complete len:214 (-) Transcript_38600:508-1149(-)
MLPERCQTFPERSLNVPIHHPRIRTRCLAALPSSTWVCETAPNFTRGGGDKFLVMGFDPGVRPGMSPGPSSNLPVILRRPVLTIVSSSTSPTGISCNVLPVNAVYKNSISSNADPCSPFIVPSIMGPVSGSPFVAYSFRNWNQLSALTAVLDPLWNACMWMSPGKYRLKISATKKPFAASRRTFRTEWDRSSPCSHRSTSLLSVGASGTGSIP